MTADSSLYKGAIALRELEDGRILVLYPMLFTYRLCIGPTNVQTYDRAWCYEPEQLPNALTDLQCWDGHGAPPGPWHHETGVPQPSK